MIVVKSHMYSTDIEMAIGGDYFDKLTIMVMLSPLSKIRPTVFRVPFFLFTSSASSSTRFMYSSKPCDGGDGDVRG